MLLPTNFLADSTRSTYINSKHPYFKPETKCTMRLLAYQRSKWWKGKPSGAWCMALGKTPLQLFIINRRYISKAVILPTSLSLWLNKNFGSWSSATLDFLHKIENVPIFVYMLTLGEIILMFLTILLYFCTSILSLLTLLYIVKYCSFRAHNKHTRSGLKQPFIHQVIAQTLSYFTK